jgi:hypothetical protein
MLPVEGAEDYGEHGWVARVSHKSTDVRKSGFKIREKKNNKIRPKHTVDDTRNRLLPKLDFLSRNSLPKLKERNKNKTQTTIAQRARGRSAITGSTEGNKNSTAQNG